MPIFAKPAEMEDFEKIFWLFQQFWPDEQLDKLSLRAIFFHGMNSKENEYYCAVHDDRIVGFCSLTIINSFREEGHVAYLHDFIIESAYRDVDADTKMVELIMANMKNKGCKKIELKSGFDKKRANKFYEKNGFKKTEHLYSKYL